MSVADETPATNVVEALRRVMRDLPAIGKDQQASPQQGGYAYRGIEAITREAQGLFAKHGVVFAPHVRSYEVREIVVNGKPWTDTYALVEYTVYGPGGREDFITVGPLLAVGRDNADKGGNKCATQAFKYALLQTLCVADEKDDADKGSPGADAARRSRSSSGSRPTGAATEKQLGKLRGSARSKGVEIDVVRRIAFKKWPETGGALEKLSGGREGQASTLIDLLDGPDEKLDAAVVWASDVTLPDETSTGEGGPGEAPPDEGGYG